LWATNAASTTATATTMRGVYTIHSALGIIAKLCVCFWSLYPFIVTVNGLLLQTPNTRYSQEHHRHHRHRHLLFMKEEHIWKNLVTPVLIFSMAVFVPFPLLASDADAATVSTTLYTNANANDATTRTSLLYNSSPSILISNSSYREWNLGNGNVQLPVPFTMVGSFQLKDFVLLGSGSGGAVFAAFVSSSSEINSSS